MISENTLARLYGEENLPSQQLRYERAEKNFISHFGAQGDIRIFSAPGRTEIGGNHTDHNHGCVLAAAVDLDAIAFVRKTDNGIITVISDGFEISPVDISDTAKKKEEENTSEGLIRGMAAGLSAAGCDICGFDAYVTSDVIPGSGLSSSAAFEVLIGRIISGLCGKDISAVEIAKISQYAENEYFGKPSGLMDQTASSVGGFITIDFADTASPVIDSISCDLSAHGLELFIVDTKGSHKDLTPDYASIPAEMKSVAAFFGKTVLRELTKEQLTENIQAVREKCGDRAVLRALHFFDENERAVREAEHLRKNDTAAFLDEVKASGNSSYKYLQNICSPADPSSQGVALGLYTAESVLCGKGACRVHGGGFAGTIQAFVPRELTEIFISAEEKVFGAGCCHRLRIRPVGGTEVTG